MSADPSTFDYFTRGRPLAVAAASSTLGLDVFHRGRPFAVALDAGPATPATTYTLAAPGSVTAGQAVPITVTPDGAFAGTVTITPTGPAASGLAAATLTWTGTGEPRTATFTPTADGTLTLTGTNDGGLTDPAARVVAVAATAVSFTLSGPASGTVGLASTDFTITPNAGYTGAITPADGGAGGAFTPSGLTWAGTDEPKTFTYTPASGGTVSIGATADPALTNSSGPVAFTAGTAPLVAGTLSLGSVTRDSITLAIGAPSGGSGATTYQVFRAARVGAVPDVAVNAPAAIAGPLTHTDSGLPFKAAFSYVVRFSDGTDTVDSGVLDAATFPVWSLGIAMLGDSLSQIVGPGIATTAAQVGDAVSQVYGPGTPQVRSSRCDYSGSWTGLWVPSASAAQNFPMGGVTYTGAHPLFTAEARMDADLAGSDFRVASLMFGMNDCDQDGHAGISGATFRANLLAIADHLIDHDHADLVVIHHPTYATRTGRSATSQGLLQVDYPAAIEALEDGTRVVVGSRDTFARFAVDQGTLLDASGIHPNGAGVQALQKLWADGIVAGLNRIGVAPSTAATGIFRVSMNGGLS